MMFSADFRARCLALQRHLDARARQEVRDWLRGYNDHHFAEAVVWLLSSDFSLLVSDHELTPACRALHIAVDELSAHVGAESFSGWGDQPAPDEMVSIVAEYVGRPVLRLT